MAEPHVAPILLLGLLLAAGVRPLAAADYINLIERYARCDDRAPYELLAQPHSQQKVPPGLIGAAIVLHTHAAAVARDAEEGGWQLDRAIALFGPASADQSAPNAPRALYLDLYVLRTAYYQVAGELLQLREHLRRMPPDLPRATGFVLRGEAEEFYNSPLASFNLRAQLEDRSRPASMGRRDWLVYSFVRGRDTAIDYFRTALAAAPDEAEAHVRLGRLLALAGKPDEAEIHLRAAARPPANPVVRYWAHLLLGRVLQRKLDVGGAEAAYREAVRLQPSAQTARLALAQLLWTGARSAEATTLIVVLASNVIRGGVRDPWWDYIFGPYWRQDELITDMQHMVRRCR